MRLDARRADAVVPFLPGALIGSLGFRLAAEARRWATKRVHERSSSETWVAPPPWSDERRLWAASVAPCIIAWRRRSCRVHAGAGVSGAGAGAAGAADRKSTRLNSGHYCAN